MLSLNSLLQILLDRARLLSLQSGISLFPVGLTERLFILCRTARSLIFDLSSLTKSLLAGKCSFSCELSLSSFLARFPTEDTLLHWFQRFDIQVEPSSQHMFRCIIVRAHATTSKCHSIDSLVRQRRKHSFSLEDLKVSERIFQVSHNEWMAPT